MSNQNITPRELNELKVLLEKHNSSLQELQIRRNNILKDLQEKCPHPAALVVEGKEKVIIDQQTQKVEEKDVCMCSYCGKTWLKEEPRTTKAPKKTD